LKKKLLLLTGKKVNNINYAAIVSSVSSDKNLLFLNHFVYLHLIHNLIFKTIYIFFKVYFIFSNQGILETEVSFYTELLPELGLLGSPLPRTFPVLWGDSKTLNREILLLQDPVSQGFESAIGMQKNGLDLGHVILVIVLLSDLIKSTFTFHLDTL
jgi:hypothetical protein